MKKRDYDEALVDKLGGTVHIEHSIASTMAKKFRKMLEDEPYVPAFGAYNAQQAIQQVKAGVKAIYCSGWQVAASANTSGNVYPDQSLYPVDSVPVVVRNINNGFRRLDQIEYSETGEGFEFAPIIADAEAGFGGVLNSYELARHLIEAGAAAVHFEDQLASAKKCGHLGGKVLIPLSDAIRNLNAARLAADVAGADTVIIARTDAESATLLSSNKDTRDGKWITRHGASGSASVIAKTSDGFFKINNGIDLCIERGQAYAQYADLVWCETSKPCLKEAKRWADGVRAAVPDAMLAYNCSPSFNWLKAIPGREELENFQKELAKMGYRFQFITLAGFHATNYAVFDFARQYLDKGMAAYSDLQVAETEASPFGYTGVKHQREVGTGYFDLITTALESGRTSAMAGSTEEEQF